MSQYEILYPDLSEPMRLNRTNAIAALQKYKPLIAYLRVAKDEAQVLITIWPKDPSINDWVLVESPDFTCDKEAVAFIKDAGLEALMIGASAK